MFRLIITLLIALVLVWIIRSLFRGAIFVPTHVSKIKTILEFADVKPGKIACDLGSGDGRVVIALAEGGAIAHGYENNPFLVWWSRYKIKKLGLSGRARIYWKSFWRADLSNYDIVFVFGIDHIMRRLENKLQKELKPGARVISFIFDFPTWKPAQERDGIKFYR